MAILKKEKFTGKIISEIVNLMDKKNERKEFIYDYFCNTEFVLKFVIETNTLVFKYTESFFFFFF